MAWVMVVQALVTLWLALSCWRYSKRAAEDSAAQWQRLAELRMHHNALESATSDALSDIGQTLEALESQSWEGQPLRIAAARCNCPRCREQRKLAVN